MTCTSVAFSVKEQIGIQTRATERKAKLSHTLFNYVKVWVELCFVLMINCNINSSKIATINEKSEIKCCTYVFLIRHGDSFYLIIH